MRNPVQEYNIARSMPIQALAAVLQGKSDMVSLGVAHAALKEKMEAEVAKKGASAMQMAQAPKVKDKDLAMAQGLGASPADIDVPMGGIVGGEGTFGTGAAGGGSVVAFQEGGRSMFGRYLETPGPMGFFDFIRQGSQPTGKQQILKEIEKTMPRPFEALSDEEYNKRMQRVKELQSLVAASPEQRLRSELEGGPMAPALPSTAQTATATAAVPTQAPSGIAALQSDTGGVPTQTLAGIEEAQAAQKAQKERAATSDPFAMLNKAQAVVSSVMGPDVESSRDQKPEEFMTDIMGAMRKAGVDFGMMKDQMAELAKEKEEIKGGKKEAANLRLLEAGLGILGGESPYAFVNIGKGASPALKGFAEDIKDIQKQSRIIDKETRELARMQNQMALGTAKFGMESYERKQDRVARAQEAKARNETQLLSTVLGGEYQLKAARERDSVPTGTERLIERFGTDPKFREAFISYQKELSAAKGTNKGLEMYRELVKSDNPLALEEFKKNFPDVARLYERQIANEAASGAMVTSLESGTTIRN
jgi:hypothetical protein